MKLKNPIKATISFVLVIIMICSLSIPIYADDNVPPTVTPRWTSIATMDLVMGFYDNEGIVAATARKQSTASHIVGALYLYKWNGSTYEYIDDVWGSKTVGTLAVSIDFVAEKGVQYKAVWVVVAYTDGVGETETITYYETCK